MNNSKDSYKPDDEALLEKFKNGDRESFNMLVERYQKQAVNYIYRLSRDFGLAEDIVQMALLTLYQKASLFRASHKFRPWFYKILTNLYYYELRKRKFSPRDPLEFSDRSIDIGRVEIMNGKSKWEARKDIKKPVQEKVHT